MKPHYFEQDQADQDDLLLKQAIYDGVVPYGCLNSGKTVIGLFAFNNTDPCSCCEGPRQRCGGRPNNIGKEAV